MMNPRYFIFIIILIMIPTNGTTHGIAISPSSVTGTGGYDIRFKLTSFLVVDDYDLFASGEWHIFIKNQAGQVLAYAQEISVSDDQTATINLIVNLKSINGFNLIFRAAENDGTSSTLEPIPDYDRVKTIAVSLNTVNQNIVLSNQYDGSNVYYNYEYYVTNSAPILSNPNPITQTYGRTITYPSVQVTDEESTIQSCYYDFMYTGSFGNDGSSPNCAGFSVAMSSIKYPSQAGTLQYAISATDKKGANTIVYGNLQLNNLAPLVSHSSTPTNIRPNEGFQPTWMITDYNIQNYTIWVNQAFDYDNTITRVVEKSQYTVSRSYSWPTAGTYNITIEVQDTLGLRATNTISIIVSDHTISDLEILTPIVNENYIDEVLIEWMPAVDSWGHPIGYSIEFTQNDGAIWYPLVNSLSGTQYIWDTTALERGEFYNIRITAASIDLSMAVELDQAFHLREVHVITNLAITNPNLGDVVNGEILISWDPAIDNWGHNVNYTVFYAESEALIWNKIVDGSYLTQTNWDTTFVTDGKYLIKVEVMDESGNTVAVTSEEFEVVNTVVTTITTTTNTPTSTSGTPTSSETSSRTLTTTTSSSTIERTTSTTISEKSSSEDPNPAPLPGFLGSTFFLSIISSVMVIKFYRRKA